MEKLTLLLSQLEGRYRMCNKTKKAGFTLVEVLVAVVIVGLVLTAIAAAISFSVKNSSQADYRQVATRYAQDAIDIIRQKRSDLGWNQFYTNYLVAGDKCLNISTHTLAPMPVGGCTGIYELSNNNVKFRRTINVDKLGGTPQSVELTVTVKWQDGSEWRNVEVVQKLFDY